MGQDENNSLEPDIASMPDSAGGSFAPQDNAGGGASNLEANDSDVKEVPSQPDSPLAESENASNDAPEVIAEDSAKASSEKEAKEENPDSSSPSKSDENTVPDIVFVEKNQAADKAKESTEKAKEAAEKAKVAAAKMWKKLPKKWLAIGVGAVVAICIIFAVVSNIMSQPLKLDAEVTVDDVTISYPSEWTVKERTSAASWKSYTISAPEVTVTLSQEKAVYDLKNTAFLLKEREGVSSVDTEKGESLTISGHKALRVPIENSEAGSKGDALLVDMGSRVVVCTAMATGSAAPHVPATLEAIIDSAYVESLNDAITVTYMDGDTVVKEETVYNKGGGAVATPPTDVAKEGYVLSGWELEDEDVDVDITGSGSSLKVQHIIESITLQAKWDKAWTVTFTDGSGNVLKTEIVAEGKSATAPTAPTRDGYTFKSWDGDYKDVTSDRTVEAQWTKIPTTSEKNALSRAKSYLSTVGGFSYKSLVEQLEYEKFSHSDAVYAADNCGADWNAQAAEKARSYMSFMSFSRSGLIDQLEFEGFTYEQASYGANAVGL